ncbi:MAG: OB-fold domain-containing protein [Pseudomonadales bacterium]|nr:OB-fold domain-containing protein [Pseudomonadales bacterium]
MSDNVSVAIKEKVAHLLNRRVGPYNSWNPVNRTQVWQWCTAMGDNNPLYLDDEYRQDTEFDDVTAPPTMMQMWSMRDAQGNYAPGSTDKNPYELLSVLEDNGYAGIMAVSYDQTFHRYLQEGERAHHYTTLVNMTDLKTTGMGKGFFVTELAEFLTDDEEKFAEAIITYFQYETPKKQPGAKKPGSDIQKITRVHPVENYDNAHFWQGLRDGELLIQKCDSCATLRHPPQPMCSECQSLNWSTIAASGKGSIYTYTVMHYPEIPPFDYPNDIALIELEEGVRIATQLTDIKPDDIKIGMDVEMVLTEVQDDMTLPLFGPVLDKDAIAAKKKQEQQ